MKLKLTVYFGERDRTGGRFLADALAEIYARHRLAASVVMRGAEGFGAQHHLHTDRLLSLSEDLPLVSVAVDEAAPVEAALADVQALRFHGLVTVEGVSGTPHQETKLTVYVGRREPYQRIVEVLHRRGVAGATVLLGVDGTVGGERARAGFFSRNADVPLMVIALGAADRITEALPEIAQIQQRPIVTLERVRVCKRDGERLAGPDGEKLIVYGGPPLVEALREAGAAGATSLRGIWGYHGDHAPHGDSFWQLRRRAPLVTVAVDRDLERWFPVVDELTARAGLVTTERVRRIEA